MKSEREVNKMFWIVEYDNGYCSDYENEYHLDICKRYFLSEENALKFYNYIKNRLSEITDSGFENVELYCEFFYDENIDILTQE